MNCQADGTSPGPFSLYSRTLTPAPKPSENRLEEMVEDCQPATFGRDGQDVLDEKIRRAGAMNSNGLATNFSPYDCGIVDAVGFKLLPGIIRAGN